MLGAGFEQNIAIKYAQELGIEVIAVDSNKNAEGLKSVKIGIVSDIKNIEKMIEIGKKFQVDGVMTHGVEIPHVVARIAEALNTPGLKPDIADRATNKLLRSKCFKKNNVPSPKFIFVKSKQEAIIKSKNLKFPLVIKPIDSSGARGVSKINKSDEIPKKYDEATSFSNNKIVLLEEFIDGPQISTESIIIKNKIITTGFADRNYDNSYIFEPYMIEDGHTIPSNISGELKNKVIKTVEKAIKDLGINFGVAKGDIIIHNGEPKILEMAARTSGGRFATDMVPISSGINILKPLIQMSVGEKIEMSYHLYWILVKNREKFMKEMKEMKIETGSHYIPVHTMSFYKSKKKLPVTNDIAKKIVTIPIHPKLSDKEVNYIIKTVNSLLY